MSKRSIRIRIAIVALLPIVVMAVLSMYSSLSGKARVVPARLADCPASDNCVCTSSGKGGQRMQPIAWTGSSQTALEAIGAALQEMPRVKVVFESENYLQAEARSWLFRFVDDLEFLVDEENHLIHFRSASRVGYSDFGANRARMEKFLEVFRRQRIQTER